MPTLERDSTVKYRYSIRVHKGNRLLSLGLNTRADSCCGILKNSRDPKNYWHRQRKFNKTKSVFKANLLSAERIYNNRCMSTSRYFSME